MATSGDDPVFRIKILPLLQGFGPVASAILAAAGLFVDQLSNYARLGLLGLVLVLAAVSIIASARQSVRENALRGEKQELEQLLSEMDVGSRNSGEEILRATARAFVSGSRAWRITVYLVEDQPKSGWVLRRVCRVSSSPALERSGRDVIPVAHTLLRGMDRFDLADTYRPYADQSGEFADPEVDLDEWIKLQSSIVGSESIARGLKMRSRKYAWCAARQEYDSRRTVVMMVESEDPDGVKVDAMSSQLIPAFLSMVADMSMASDSFKTLVSASQRALRAAPG